MVKIIHAKDYQSNDISCKTIIDLFMMKNLLSNSFISHSIHISNEQSHNIYGELDLV